MKITSEHFEEMRNAIFEAYSKDSLYSEWQKYKDRRLTKTRFVWDALWGTKYLSKLDEKGRSYINGKLGYLNDSHITTALLKIFEPLGLE